MKHFTILLLPTLLLAQATTLSGRVLDTQDQPVSYAGILLKNATANQLRNLGGYIYQTNTYAPSNLSSHGICLQKR
ncbi:MAG: hypothetical protein OTI34_06045 [Lewinella sp.]|jgi:hypothetical protein|nr:hypothetical protein [Lewinella sp.]